MRRLLSLILLGLLSPSPSALARAGEPRAPTPVSAAPDGPRPESSDEGGKPTDPAATPDGEHPEAAGKSKKKPSPKPSPKKPAPKKPAAKAPRKSTEKKGEQPAAHRYAAMQPAACLAELKKRKISFQSTGDKPGVLIPIRLNGPLRNVEWRTDFPEEKRRTVPWEILDCRLALSLDDFSAKLAQATVVEVRVFSFWRPPPKSWKRGETARRHPGALAADVRALLLKSGDWISVEKHWAGEIGDVPCGPEADAPKEDTKQALLLRELACGAADARLFQSILTPNYNKPHFNHFHLEVVAGVDWFIVR